MCDPVFALQPGPNRAIPEQGIVNESVQMR